MRSHGGISVGRDVIPRPLLVGVPGGAPLSQPGSRRDDEPKKKTDLKRDLGVTTIVILENYGKPQI